MFLPLKTTTSDRFGLMFAQGCVVVPDTFVKERQANSRSYSSREVKAIEKLGIYETSRWKRRKRKKPKDTNISINNLAVPLSLFSLLFSHALHQLVENFIDPIIPLIRVFMG